MKRAVRIPGDRGVLPRLLHGDLGVHEIEKEETEMREMIRLKPCPFCGEKAWIQVDAMTCHVECFHKTRCYLYGRKAPRFNVPEAVAKMWNRRSTEEEKQE